VGVGVGGAGVGTPMAVLVVDGDGKVVGMLTVATCNAEGGSRNPATPTQFDQPGCNVAICGGAESVGEQGLYETVYSDQEDAVKLTNDPVVSG